MFRVSLYGYSWILQPSTTWIWSRGVRRWHINRALCSSMLWGLLKISDSETLLYDNFSFLTCVKSARTTRPHTVYCVKEQCRTYICRGELKKTLPKKKKDLGDTISLYSQDPIYKFWMEQILNDRLVFTHTSGCVISRLLNSVPLWSTLVWNLVR